MSAQICLKMSLRFSARRKREPVSARMRPGVATARPRYAVPKRLGGRRRAKSPAREMMRPFTRRVRCASERKSTRWRSCRAFNASAPVSAAPSHINIASAQAMSRALAHIGRWRLVRCISRAVSHWRKGGRIDCAVGLGPQSANSGNQTPAISTARTSGPYFFSFASPMPEMRGPHLLTMSEAGEPVASGACRTSTPAPRADRSRTPWTRCTRSTAFATRWQ